jgi:nucleoid-associated protein Lsr2
MVRKVTVAWVDDVSDKSPADETVSFALDGARYEIDLSAKNAKKLRAQLQPWIDASRRVAGRKRRRVGVGKRFPQGSDRAQTAAIREWAHRNGYEVSSRGRLPRAVLDAYRASA